MQNIPVFIASPSDVSTERDLVDAAIGSLSRRLRENLGVVLDVLRWEDFAPRTTSSGRRRFQDEINSRLEKCGIFVGILHRRYGTEIDSRRRYSGTESEFRHALRNRRRIAILTYFREPATARDRNERKQLATLKDLKSRLKQAGVAAQVYRSPQDLQRRFAFDLLDTVFKLIGDVDRKKRLLSFFPLGISSRRETPSVLTAYPTIHKHQHPAELPTETTRASTARPTYDWRSRLLPNVVYEDFKAIQKLEAAFRLIGVTDLSAVTLDHPDLQREIGNRVWLCLPRNRLARDQLQRLGERARFRFNVPQDSDTTISWRPPIPRSAEIEVASPLSAYLALQREDGRYEWSPELGRIVARDFAVLARFAVLGGNTRQRGEPYYHYFVAGIRGLGTWGVGWLVDHRPEELSRILRRRGNSRRNVQALLEVTYENYRIREVVDVSDAPAEYFRERNSVEFVQGEVKRFTEAQ